MAASADSPEGKLAIQLYDQIIAMSNRFLHHCSTFSIGVLALKNPSYDEIAKQFAKVAEIVELISADFDPMMGQKAMEYCQLMAAMGNAIANHDVETLSKLTDEMARKPGL